MPKAQLCRVHAHVPQALASRVKGPWSHDYETAYRRLQARGQLLRPDAAGRPQPVECATAWWCHSWLPRLPLTPGFVSGLLQRSSQAADTQETASFAAVKDCRLSGSLCASHSSTRLRFARLCAFLRLKPPLASAGNSIFVWRLSEADLHEALHEAPVELVPSTALSPALREHQLHVILELQRKLSA